MRRRLEKKIERDFARYVKSQGEECLKFSSPGTKGLPDRIIPFGGPLDDGEHALLGHTFTWFVEFKRSGETLDPDGPQQFWKDILEMKGYRVDVFDNLDEAIKVFDQLKRDFGI